MKHPLLYSNSYAGELSQRNEPGLTGERVGRYCGALVETGLALQTQLDLFKDDKPDGSQLSGTARALPAQSLAFDPQDQ